MRVSIEQGGGMTGLVSTTVADSASLSPTDAEALRAKVEEAGLFDLPSNTEGSDQPDRPTYAITVEDDARRNEVVVSDATLPDAVRSVISFVGSVPGHEERIGRP